MKITIRKGAINAIFLDQNSLTTNYSKEIKIQVVKYLLPE